MRSCQILCFLKECRIKSQNTNKEFLHNTWQGEKAMNREVEEWTKRSNNWNMEPLTPLAPLQTQMHWQGN